MAKEINLKEILGVIKKRLWVIAILTILATLSGYLYTMIFTPTPLYQSSTRILIGEKDSNSMSTLKVMIKDPTVLEKVSTKLAHQRSPAALDTEIKAENIDESQIISISVTDRDPALAANIADTTARVFKGAAEDVLNLKKVQLLSEAKMNNIPINPTNHYKTTAIGFVIGGIIGVGLAFLLHSMDDSIQTERSLEKLLGVPMLGTIPKMSRKNMYRGKRASKATIEILNADKKEVANKKTSVDIGRDHSYKNGPEPIRKANYNG